MSIYQSTREWAPSPEPFLGNPLPAAALGLRGRTLWAKPSPYPQSVTVFKTEESSTTLTDIPRPIAQAEDALFVISPKFEPTEIISAFEGEDEDIHDISFYERARSPSAEVNEDLTPYSANWPKNRAVQSIEPLEPAPILATRHVRPEDTIFEDDPMTLDIRTNFQGWTPINASTIIKKRTRDNTPVVRPTRLVTPNRPIKSFRRSPPRTPYNLEGPSSSEDSPCFSDQLSSGWSPNSSLHLSDDEEEIQVGEELEAEKGKAKRTRHSPSPPPSSTVTLAIDCRRSPRLSPRKA